MNATNPTVTSTSLGELISALYDEFLAVYGDEEIASLATAATINELLADEAASRGHPAHASAA
jgi:hypothetical protein